VNIGSRRIRRKTCLSALMKNDTSQNEFGSLRSRYNHED
jgi:hypothetical protein